MSKAEIKARHVTRAYVGRVKVYDVFTRDWWKPAESAGWLGGREPCGDAPKTYLERGVSWSRARAICAAWNDTHDPGPMSNKAEFEEAE